MVKPERIEIRLKTDETRNSQAHEFERRDRCERTRVFNKLPIKPKIKRNKNSASTQPHFSLTKGIFLVPSLYLRGQSNQPYRSAAKRERLSYCVYILHYLLRNTRSAFYVGQSS